MDSYKYTREPNVQGSTTLVVRTEKSVDRDVKSSLDLYKLIRKYLNQWAKKIAHVHRHAPSGMVKSAVFVDADAYLNLLAKDVQPTTRCHTCNGEYMLQRRFFLMAQLWNAQRKLWIVCAMLEN